jgi:hypothetical protein
MKRMAKGVQKSNREKKKPKQDKSKPSVETSIYSAGKSNLKVPSSKKKK